MDVFSDVHFGVFETKLKAFALIHSPFFILNMFDDYIINFSCNLHIEISVPKTTTITYPKQKNPIKIITRELTKNQYNIQNYAI